MKQVDLDPRRHSSSYELKPMSRWWLVLAVALSLIPITLNGWQNVATWALLFCGWMIGFAAILTNPKRWLSKLRD